MTLVYQEQLNNFSTFSPDEPDVVPDVAYQHYAASDEAWRNSMYALDLNEALQWRDKIPEMDYFRRLCSLTDAVDRFSDDLDETSHLELQDDMNQNALNLAAKTLPHERIEEIGGDVSIPLDDIGFSRPPALSDAMAVAVCWDKTSNTDVFKAAYLMFETIGDASAEAIEALGLAMRNGTHFRSELQEICHRNIRPILPKN